MSDVDPLPLLEASVDHVLAVLDGVTEVDLARATPCPDWDLRALLLHLADAAGRLASGAEPGDPAPAPPGTDPVVLAAGRSRHLLDVVRAGLAAGPGAEQRDRLSGAALGGAIELAAHGWDVATVTGGPSLPASHATAVLALAEQLVTDEARAAFFGPAVEVGPEAAPGDRFAAFLGRDPAARPGA